MAESNVGTDCRDKRAHTNPDEELQAADLSDFGAVLSTGGGIIYYRGFMEVRMPLITDEPLTEKQNFETGNRHSSYDLEFKTNIWKTELGRTLAKDVRLRAGCFDMGALGKLTLTGTYINAYDVAQIQLNSGTGFNCAGFCGPSSSTSLSPAMTR
jgi:hypothetical protein